MAKRSTEETINEDDSSSEFKYDDSENQLRKKIKLENHKILDKIKEIEEQPQEETDGFVYDAILQIVNTIAGLLRNNIGSLNIPAVLKSALKKIKELVYSANKRLRRG